MSKLKGNSQEGAVTLKLADIARDDAFMVRAALDADTIAGYAEAMEEGAEFPPVDVYELEGGTRVLVDGWHRMQAAERCGFVDIDARIRRGTKEEALSFALKANQAHGLRRTNADKHRAVKVALMAWPDMSSRSLAELCGVSHEFVTQARDQVSTVDTCKRTGKDGKSYPARVERIPRGGSGASAERDDAKKDGDESGDGDREDSLEKRRADWADWNAFEAAAATVRDGIAAMESAHVEARRRVMAAGICMMLAERIVALGRKLEG